MDELSFLPEFYDAFLLGELLLAHPVEIAKYCKVRDVMPVLQTFKAEEPISQEILHDPRRYLTISFSQEGAFAERTTEFVQGWAINPQEVVRKLALALKILNKGWGRDPACAMGIAVPLELSGISYMTLDWQNTALYPALRYDLTATEVTPRTVDIIVDVIRKGRRAIPLGRGVVMPAARS